MPYALSFIQLVPATVSEWFYRKQRLQSGHFKITIFINRGYLLLPLSLFVDSHLWDEVESSAVT
jgi:hypothetical protein